MTRTMTEEQERQALVGELTSVALAHVRQNKIIETAQAEVKKLAAEERRILKQLAALDADTGSDTGPCKDADPVNGMCPVHGAHVMPHLDSEGDK